MGSFHNIAMPLGISFWTFQALSYLFDLYREEDLDPSFLEFCLYMAFWPTVVMGPICRLSKMLPQFREFRCVSGTDARTALARIGSGLVMKLILAQLLSAAIQTPTFASGLSSSGLSGLDVWFIAIGFGFQLFFDFAGYSHIVIGAAQLFGFSLEENFDAPFLALTPSAFRTKWRMSLSSWIRDYVFMPAASLRRDLWWRYHFSAALSMLLFGLWHGATITFLLWGLYHGIFLVLLKLVQQYGRTALRKVPETVQNGLAWCITFFGVSLSWILFRSRDLAEPLRMFKAVGSPAAYFHLSLSADSCRLIFAVAVGYLTYAMLSRSSSAREAWQRLIRTDGNGAAPPWDEFSGFVGQQSLVGCSNDPYDSAVC